MEKNYGRDTNLMQDKPIGQTKRYKGRLIGQEIAASCTLRVLLNIQIDFLLFHKIQNQFVKM
jgi:hypothetical protein